MRHSSFCRPPSLQSSWSPHNTVVSHYVRHQCEAHDRLIAPWLSRCIRHHYEAHGCSAMPTINDFHLSTDFHPSTSIHRRPFMDFRPLTSVHWLSSTDICPLTSIHRLSSTDIHSSLFIPVNNHILQTLSSALYFYKILGHGATPCPRMMKTQPLNHS